MRAEDRSRLATERALPQAAELDRMDLEEAYELFQAEDLGAVRALEACRDSVLRTVELATARLATGGRLLYVGAGTSGRLAVLDASECPPTFQSAPDQVQGVIAGGSPALTSAVEGAEDSRDEGRAAMDEREVGSRDVVLGISAGGTTPFVHAALGRARELGAATVFLACVPKEECEDDYDLSIRIPSGPEILAGSTRLKAGTVTKLVLNRISTLVMVGLGKTFGNRMVDLDTRANRKLRQRGVALLASIAGVDAERAALLLDAAEGQVKPAVLMARLGLDLDQARARLEAHGGFLRDALEAGD